MRHYPIFMDLTGRRALVLGAGDAAERKAASLRAAGADVVVEARFAPALLDGCVLAIGAGAPEAELRALSHAAQLRAIPVNVVDRPDLSTFITPAVVDRDPVTVAISTGGEAPVLANGLRARIEAAIPPGFASLVALLGRLRAELRARFPDAAQRRRAIAAGLAGAAPALAFAGHATEAEAAFRRDMQSARPGGSVALVGAGPGAPDLLTLRAQRLLGEADVIVHDRLVGAEILDLARRDARRIDAGKARARHTLPQEEINALLIGLAREGHRVVRLKGGDPLIFARGGEEAEALAAAGIPLEIVPGITAALACAAEAGIPLTHRDAAQSLTMVTGHTREGRLDLDFAMLARARTTLAVYMGLLSLPQLCAGLLAAGLAPATPAAIVESGETPARRVLFADVSDLAARARDWSTGGPALVLIGPAIGRRVRPPDQTVIKQGLFSSNPAR